MDSTNNQNKNGATMKDLVHIYTRETIEVFITIMIIRVALDKPVELYETMISSLFIAVLTTILEFYDKEYKKSLRQGINALAGTQLISKVINH